MWIIQPGGDPDAAVAAAAYGWAADLADEEVLRRLVALNRERAAEERRGVVRWLRPAFQNPTGRAGAAVELARSFAKPPLPRVRELLEALRLLGQVRQVDGERFAG